MTEPKRPRILLSIGPGTLPSQGIDRLDFTHYNIRLSGKPPLTGPQMVAALPEINSIADIVFDDNFETKYVRALGKLGVDPAMLVSNAGHG